MASARNVCVGRQEGSQIGEAKAVEMLGVRRIKDFAEKVVVKPAAVNDVAKAWAAHVDYSQMRKSQKQGLQRNAGVRRLSTLF